MSGCTSPGKATTKPSSQPATQRYTITTSAKLLHPADPRDPAPDVPTLVHLDIYRIDMPLGTISQNEAFWKRADEQCVDVATSRLLFINGIRCGAAPRTEWEFFRQFLAANPDHVIHQAVDGVRGSFVELDMSKPADAEDLFIFDHHGRLEGRSYEHCMNLVGLTFEPAARKPNAVRIALTPAVRGTRHRLEFTPTNQELEPQFVDIDRLYDVNLRLDLDQGDFLIVTPSADAVRDSSIGRRFFTTDTPGQRLEHVLIILPALLHLDGTPSSVTQMMPAK